MKRNFKLLTSLITIFSIAGCTATTAPKIPKNIEKGNYTYVKEYMRWYIKEQMEENSIVGLSVALVDDQKIVWQEGFGYEDRSKNIKATPQTRYWAGSITKLFTGMGVMKLVEEGKMDIDKPFRTYLPEFSIKSRFGSTDTITPRNIMTHHSGLPGEWLDRMFSLNPLPYTDYVTLIKNEYTAYPPNTIMSYSNLAVTLLGHAVEKVAGQTYADYINKQLLQPLEMKNSDFKMDFSAAHTSKSYLNNEETTEYPIGEVPAGALGTTVTDLSHLAMMVNASGRFNGKEVLKASSLEKMFEVQNENVPLDMGNKIGLSWFIDEKTLGQENPIYGHGGGTTAHRSMLFVSPNSKLAVVVLTNSAEGTAANIANTLLKKAYEAKTGIKLSTLKTKKTNLKGGDDFEGVYASILGKVKIQKKSDGEYRAYSASGNFSLSINDKKEYHAKYLLWNFIPLGNDELNELSFYTKTINGEKLVLGVADGHEFIVGVKVKTKPIPETWKKHLGQYQIINQLEPKYAQIKQVTAKIEDGFPVIVTETMLGDKIVEIVNIVNDSEAIIEGLGRSKRETIYIKDGIFHHSGLRFKKVLK